MAPDPTNQMYYFTLLAMVCFLGKDSEFFRGDYNSIIQRVHEPLTPSLMKGLVENRYKRMRRGVLHDGGDVIEAVAGILHTYNPNALKIRTSLRLSENERKQGLHVLGLVVRRTVELAVRVCRDFHNRETPGWKEYLIRIIRAFGSKEEKEMKIVPNIPEEKESKRARMTLSTEEDTPMNKKEISNSCEQSESDEPSSCTAERWPPWSEVEQDWQSWSSYEWHTHWSWHESSPQDSMARASATVYRPMTSRPTAKASTHRAYQEVEINCAHVKGANGLIDGIREEEFKKRFNHKMRARVYYCHLCQKRFGYQYHTAAFYGDFVNRIWNDTLELVEMFNDGRTDARWRCVRCEARQRNATNWYDVATEMRATPNRIEASNRIKDTECRQAFFNFPVPRERR